jgi:hypothetical protein
MNPCRNDGLPIDLCITTNALRENALVDALPPLFLPSAFRIFALFAAPHVTAIKLRKKSPSPVGEGRGEENKNKSMLYLIPSS